MFLNGFSTTPGNIIDAVYATLQFMHSLAYRTSIPPQHFFSHSLTTTISNCTDRLCHKHSLVSPFEMISGICESATNSIRQFDVTFGFFWQFFKNKLQMDLENIFDIFRIFFSKPKYTNMFFMVTAIQKNHSWLRYDASSSKLRFGFRINSTRIVIVSASDGR